MNWFTSNEGLPRNRKLEQSAKDIFSKRLKGMTVSELEMVMKSTLLSEGYERNEIKSIVNFILYQ